jgi:hypothetical protein
MVTYQRKSTDQIVVSTKGTNAKHKKKNDSVANNLVRTKQIVDLYDKCDTYDKCVIADYLENNENNFIKTFNDVQLLRLLLNASSKVRQTFYKTKHDELKSFANNIIHLKPKIESNIPTAEVLLYPRIFVKFVLQYKIVLVNNEYVIKYIIEKLKKEKELELSTIFSNYEIDGILHTIFKKYYRMSCIEKLNFEQLLSQNLYTPISKFLYRDPYRGLFIHIAQYHEEFFTLLLQIHPPVVKFIKRNEKGLPYFCVDQKAYYESLKDEFEDVYNSLKLDKNGSLFFNISLGPNASYFRNVNEFVHQLFWISVCKQTNSRIFSTDDMQYNVKSKMDVFGLNSEYIFSVFGLILTHMRKSITPMFFSLFEIRLLMTMMINQHFTLDNPSEIVNIEDLVFFQQVNVLVFRQQVNFIYMKMFDNDIGVYTIWSKRKKENETHEDVKEKIINILCDFECKCCTDVDLHKDKKHSTVDQCLDKKAVMFLRKLFAKYEQQQMI